MDIRDEINEAFDKLINFHKAEVAMEDEVDERELHWPLSRDLGGKSMTGGIRAMMNTNGTVRAAFYMLSYDGAEPGLVMKRTPKPMLGRSFDETADMVRPLIEGLLSRAIDRREQQQRDLELERKHEIGRELEETGSAIVTDEELEAFGSDDDIAETL